MVACHANKGLVLWGQVVMVVVELDSAPANTPGVTSHAPAFKCVSPLLVVQVGRQPSIEANQSCKH